MYPLLSLDYARDDNRFDYYFNGHCHSERNACPELVEGIVQSRNKTKTITQFRPCGEIYFSYTFTNVLLISNILRFFTPMNPSINKAASHWLLFLVIIAIHLHACTPHSEQPLRVAVASNARFVAEEIAENFTEQTGQEVELIVSSSGKLTAQILEGAPYDVFLSADIHYPNTLYENGKTTSKPVIYAYGTLGFWTTKEVLALDDLPTESVSRIACANPETAPYGKATIEVLKAAGLYSAISDKLIFGESVGQVSQFIFSKAADVGFVPSSLSGRLDNKVDGQWIAVDKSLYTPIEQGVVIIKKKGGNQAIAEQFYKFLLTDKSKAILQTHGYQTD